MKHQLRRSSLLALAVVSLLALSCRDGTAPPPREVRVYAPIYALFPGTRDTAVAFLGLRQLTGGEAEWHSSAPDVVEAAPGGVLTAARLGSARITVRVGEAADSFEVRVVEPPEGQIIFGGQTELWPFGAAGGDLWVMAADGTGLRRVWQPRAPGWGTRRGGASNPSFSPDGCYAVFQGRHPGELSPSLYVLNLRTGAARQITIGGSGTPAWSPDGERIVFSGLLGGGFELLSIRPDGSDLRVHTAIGSPGALRVDFYPGDPRRLVSERVMPASDGDIQADLYDFDLETGEWTPLLARPDTSERDPAIAPDGQEIAFLGEVEGMPWDIGSTRLLHAGGHTRLLHAVSRTAPFHGRPEGIVATSGDPTFSPDSEWLAISWNRDQIRSLTAEGEEQVNTLGEIYVIRRDGTNPVRLTHMAVAHDPDWSPACAGISP